MYKYLSEVLLSVPLGMYLEGELLDHMVILCLTCGRTLGTFKESVNHRSRFFQNLCFSSPNKKCLLDLVFRACVHKVRVQSVLKQSTPITTCGKVREMPGGW